MQTIEAERAVYSPEEIERYAAEIEENGYVILPDVLSPDELGEARAALDGIFKDEAEIGPQRGWHTQQHRAAYMLPQKHPFFRQLPLHPRVLPLMQRMLGPGVVMASLNGMTMTPGGEDQRLHLDQPMTVPGTVLYINAMACLDDFTVANGATRIVPRSQSRVLSWDADRSQFEAETIRLTAPAGSFIAFNGGLWHAGSRNTTDAYRRALHLYYSRWWVRPQWDYARSLTPDVVESMTPEQRKIFGLDNRVPYYDRATDTRVYS